MEWLAIFWVSAPSCYLELLDKLEKWICRIVGPSVTTSLELMAHHKNVASLRFSVGITIIPNFLWTDIYLNWLN